MTDRDIQQTVEKIRQRFRVQLASDEIPVRVYIRHGIVFFRSVVLIVFLLFITALLTRLLIGQSHTAWAVILIIGGTVAVGLLIALVYLYIDWRNDALILTDQRLIYVEQVVVFSRKQREAALRNVQNVRSDVRGLLPRILDFGTIVIETAARGTDITFGPIHDPRQAKEDIQDRARMLRSQASEKLREQTLLHALDPDRFPAPEPVAVAAAGTPAPQKLRGEYRTHFLANPRIEGDKITWYKHWYFLIRRLAWSLFLLAFLIGVAFFLPSLEESRSAWLFWVVAVLIALAVLEWNYQIWRGDIYVLTADSIHDIYRTPFGIFGQTERSAGLEKIQNISLDQPTMLSRLLNFGNVRIRTAGLEDFTFNHVPRPGEVQYEISRRQELHRLRQEQREREQIAEWLATFRTVSERLQGEKPEELST